jgi:hypothetical protein
MKSQFTRFLYLIVPIVFLFGVAVEFVLGDLPGTQWYPILTSWPLILLAFLFIVFSIKARRSLGSSPAEISGEEEFWKRWAGMLWIFWAFYIVLAYFIPDPTVYFIDLGLKLPFTIFYLIITLPLGLFIQFNSHRSFWRFFAFCIFTLQALVFLLDHASF